MYTCSLHLYKIQVCYLCVWTFFLWEKKTFIWPWTSPLTERTRRWDLWWRGWWLPGGCSPRWSVPSAQTCAPGGGGSCTQRTEPGGPFSAGCKQSHYSQIMLDREREREREQFIKTETIFMNKGENVSICRNLNSFINYNNVRQHDNYMILE